MTNKINDYLILEGWDKSYPDFRDYNPGSKELQSKVLDALKEGYSLYGDMIYENRHYIQVVVKYASDN